jgi:ATP/maltotriose-dependent transcriptional regulator MalT
MAPPDHPTARFAVGLQWALSRSKQGEPRAALEELAAIDDLLERPDLLHRAGTAVQELTVRIGRVEAFVVRGTSLRRLGRLEEAAAPLIRSLELAREFRIASIEAEALTALAELARARGDVAEQTRWADALGELTRPLGSPLWEAISRVTSGDALLASGDAAAGIASIERGIALCRERGLVMESESQALSLLSRARLEAGDSDRAFDLASEAVALAERSGDRSLQILAGLAEARAGVRVAGADAALASLARVVDLIEQTGSALFAPQVAEARAELAAVAGQADAREQSLREARRLYTEMQARGHAERITRLLGEDEA